MIINDYPENTAEDVVVACFKLKSWHSVGAREKSLELEYMPNTIRVQFKHLSLNKLPYTPLGTMLYIIN
jgi:hypothetical protein